MKDTTKALLVVGAIGGGAALVYALTRPKAETPTEKELLYNTFEEEMDWLLWNYKTGGLLERTTEQAKVGNYSMKMQTTTEQYHRLSAYKSVPTALPYNLFTFDVSFYIPSLTYDNIQVIEFALNKYINNRRLEFAVQWVRNYPPESAESWRFWSDKVIWEPIPSGKQPLETDFWHRLTLVGNYATKKYVQLTVDGKTWDLSGYGIADSSFTAEPTVVPDIEIENNPLGSMIVYCDEIHLWGVNGS